MSADPPNAAAAAMYGAITCVRAELASEPGARRSAEIDRVVVDMHERFGAEGVLELVMYLASMGSEYFKRYPDPTAELDAHEQSVMQLEVRSRDER